MTARQHNVSAAHGAGIPTDLPGWFGSHDGQPAYLAITILRLRGETSIAAFPAPPRAPGH